MNNQIEKLIKNIPLVTLGVYLVGFIVFQLHLSQFGFVDNQIVNFQYLVVGLITLVSFLPFFIGTLFYSEFEKTNLPGDLYVSPLKISVIVVIVMASLLAAYLFNPETTYHLWGLQYDLNTILIIHSIVLVIIVLLIFKYTKDKILLNKRINNISMYSIFSLSTIPMLRGHISLSTFIMLNITLLLLVSRNWFEGVKLNGIEIKALNTKYIFIPFIILVNSYFFGLYIYKEIPNYLGGGKMDFSTLIIKEGEEINIKRFRGLPTTNNLLIKVKIIHQNQDYYFIQTKESINTTISKNLFVGIQ